MEIYMLLFRAYVLALTEPYSQGTVHLTNKVSKG